MDMEAFRSEVDMIAEQCMASRLRLLNRSVNHIYDGALRPLGLTSSQLSLLVAITKMGEAKPATLCAMFHMDASTLSRNVDRMRHRGWVAASPGENGRTVLLTLTPPGQDLLRSAITAWQAAQERATDLLGQEGVSMIHAMTRTLDRIQTEA